MKCLYCFHDDTKVVDKRDSGGVTRRRRECLKCTKRFTTYERPELSLVVIKKDGSREAFDREKVKSGVLKASKNRPVTAEDIDRLVEEVEAHLKSLESIEVPSQTVGEAVMRRLRKLDDVAYIRFASVYRNFESIREFEKEVKAIKR